MLNPFKAKPYTEGNKAKLYSQRSPNAIIAVITKDTVEPACLQSLQSQNYPSYSVLIHQLKPTFSSSNPTINGLRNMIDNREQVRKMVLGSDAEWVLWVDSDIILPPDALTNLILHKKELIAGYYQTKGIAPLWVGGMFSENKITYLDEPHPSVICVDHAGLGCMLTSTYLLGLVQFKDGTNQACMAFDGARIIDDSTQFSLECKRAGFQMYLNGDVICGHIDRANEDSYQ